MWGGWAGGRAARLVKDDALAAEVVDLVAEGLVLPDGLVEADDRLLEAVLEDLLLLLDLRPRLPVGVDAWEGARGDDAFEEMRAVSSDGCRC